MSRLGATSRRLRIGLSEQLGRRYAVRLRAYSGMLVLVDQDRRVSHWYSWETDEPEDSPANIRHLAGIIETERLMALPSLTEGQDPAG